ncbi:MAG: hypothetical protein P8Y47_12165 [Alphaproteobacteria bacterium]
MNDTNCRPDRRHVSFHLSGGIINQIKAMLDHLTVPDVLAALVNVTAMTIVRSSADPVMAHETANAFAAVFERAFADRLQQRGWR